MRFLAETLGFGLRLLKILCSRDASACMHWTKRRVVFSCLPAKLLGFHGGPDGPCVDRVRRVVISDIFGIRDEDLSAVRALAPNTQTWI